MNHKFLVLCIFFLWGCSPITTSADATQPSVSASTQLAEASYYFPPECVPTNSSTLQNDREWLKYENQACKLFHVSQSGKFLAYVTPLPRSDPNRTRLVDSVRILERGSREATEIYRSTHYAVSDLTWGIDDLLVVTDAQLEGGFGKTIVVDVPHKQVLEILDGEASFSAWNKTMNAFAFVGGHNGSCERPFVGYDLVKRQKIPDVISLFPDLPAGDLVFTNKTGWSLDGRMLFVETGILHFDASKQDYVWGPTLIAAINLSETDPAFSIIRQAQAVNYMIVDAGSQLEILERPYQEKYCYGE